MVYKLIPPCPIEQGLEDNILVDIFISIITLSIYSILLDYITEKRIIYKLYTLYFILICVLLWYQSKIDNYNTRLLMMSIIGAVSSLLKIKVNKLEEGYEKELSTNLELNLKLLKNSNFKIKNDIRKINELIFENNEKINEGLYLELSNQLKELYNKV